MFNYDYNWSVVTSDRSEISFVIIGFPCHQNSSRNPSYISYSLLYSLEQYALTMLITVSKKMVAFIDNQI